jgi:uncharacterized protein YxeA
MSSNNNKKNNRTNSNTVAQNNQIQPTESAAVNTTISEQPANNTTQQPANNTTQQPANNTTPQSANNTNTQPANNTTTQPANNTTQKEAEQQLNDIQNYESVNEVGGEDINGHTANEINDLYSEMNNLNNQKNQKNQQNQNLEGEELETAINNRIANENKNKNIKNQAVVNGMFKASANSVSSKVSDLTENISSNETLMLVIKVVLVIILLIILINIVKYFYVRWDVSKTNNPVLIKGTKSGKQAMVISQDPNHVNYIPIKRSVDKDGIEFSYAFWFVISDFAYKNGEWKHMFHKGNSSSYPNRAPGVWIHPTNNIVRVYMNTMKNMLEFVDVDNIPLRKWVHMVISVKNKYLMIYVNGLLKVKKELSSLPRQNYGNVWANLYGGFEGFLSKLQYYDHSISSIEVDNLVTQGPGSGSCIDTNEVPPYLDDSWWLS